MNPDGTPAKGVAVVVDPGHVQALTAANGMAKITINAGASLAITVSLTIFYVYFLHYNPISKWKLTFFKLDPIFPCIDI